MNRKDDFRALTGIRGIAAWWVVLFHFNELLSQTTGGGSTQDLIGRGYLAVDLFFELSGFIIALNYADRFRKIGIAGIGNFLGLRLARIYPLHIFMLTAFLLNPLAIVLFAANPDPGPFYGPAYFVMSIFLIQNWGFTSALAWNVPAWSISTELLAYLFFPFLAWTLARFILGRTHAVIAAIVLLLIFAAVIGMTSRGLGNGIPYTGAFRCVIEFSLGVLLYRFWEFRPLDRPSQALNESRIATILALLFLGSYGVFIWPDYMLVPAGFLFLIYALTARDTIFARVMSFGPVHFLGLISYSTYLVHYFVKDWVKFILVRDGIAPSIWFAAYIGVTAVASVLLYYGVEVPGRRVARQWTERFSRRRQRTNTGRIDLAPGESS